MYLTQPLHRGLQQSPDRPMTVCGERIRTTREVADRVARLAASFMGLGAQEGARIGILALNSDRYHEFFFASWWMGGVAHPINTRWSAAEISYALTDSGTEVLLLDDTFAHLGPELREHCPGLHTLIHCGDGPTPEGMLGYEELVAEFAPAPDVRRGGDDLALLLYTGGTTGQPKGVMSSHRGLMASMYGSMLTNHAVHPGSVTLITAPLFHIAAFCSWHNQNVVGGTQVFLPVFSAQAFMETVQRHRITTSILVPVMVQAISDHPELERYDLSSLRTITYGGAGSPESLLHRAMKAFPQAEFTQGYGMTETGVLTILGRQEHHEGGPRLRSAGRATASVEIAVVGPDGAELAPGQVGEVVTRGDHLMLGYWGRPELTAEALRDGWMHTGDGGYVDDDGYLYIVDRLKDMIISGGENVYSAEVENALAAHPAVASCAVIGVPDPQWGERVHAIVVLRPGHATTAEELRAHAKTLIAGYKAPRTAEFVDSLPTSAAGKTLKRQLRDARADG
ncbi:long-chain-fatty-acid--CoA ligase [Streptacidiphilus anmyonensis]|uniref:long-chain-fatty-acid--CoA ligase n=1 Tax=Streptacidiphilus anmyonensis TaxID=405782 RepID=UPI0005AB50EF|nr:long-chain-fatty-acid--CoA ligase [Streptacidiphilus anmyonensis]